MIGFAAERLMELEVGDRTDRRLWRVSSSWCSATATRERDWQTRAGSVTLRIPPGVSVHFSVRRRRQWDLQDSLDLRLRNRAQSSSTSRLLHGSNGGPAMRRSLVVLALCCSTGGVSATAQPVSSDAPGGTIDLGRGKTAQFVAKATADPLVFRTDRIELARRQ
jgi:hypothetical protein